MSALVTVCVLTYNPDWSKLKNTLCSIICQKNVDFDIVISDDGSTIDCFDQVEMFFFKNGFNSFKLVKNVENQGTVKNTILALQHTESKYVKLISPGDFLYDENVLSEFYKFAEQNPAAVYFGNAVYYSVLDNNQIKLYDDKYNPQNLVPWIKGDYLNIRRNYLYYEDYIVGASFFCNREIFNEYVKRLYNVRYAEDFSIVWMIAARQKVLYFDKPFIFYEYGCGISTNSESILSERLHEDNIKGIELIYKNKDMSKLEYMLRISENRIIKLFCILVLDPKHVFLRFKKTNVINYIKNKSECLSKLIHILNYDKVL